MTGQEELNNLLRQGIELARTGNKALAREIFEQVIQADEFNEMAWMWMAAVARNNAERREALEIVLEINPQNENARKALDRLGGPRARRKARESKSLAERIGGEAADETAFQPVVERPEEPEPEEEAPEPEPEDAEAALAHKLLEAVREQRPAPPVVEIEADDVHYDFQAEQRQRLAERLRTLVPTILLIALGAVAVALAILGAGQILRPLVQPPTPTLQLETALAQLATPTPVTPTAAPVLLVTPVQNAHTLLPATWTPSHTPTPTATPTPSPTPLPPAHYHLIFSRLEAGTARHSLYTVRGDGANERRLTEESTDDRDPAPALDGERVLYVTDIGGGRELVIRPLVAAPRPTLNPLAGELAGDTATIPAYTVITDLGGQRTASPAWSSDGFRIVFSSNFDGDEEIYTINADGTSLAKLTDNQGTIDRDPAWSPDGNTIVFASDRDGRGETELYSMRPNGTELVRLTDSSGSSYQPAWSADSRFIVFVSDRDRDADLYIMNADGSNERLLTRNDDGAEDRNPAWSPDGRWIVFSSNRDGPNFQLYLIDPSGERLIRVTQSDTDDIEAAWLRGAPR